jgi:hypothetical protein
MVCRWRWSRPRWFVAGTALAAQHKWALQAPNGISFAEFKGYDSWQMIGSSQPDDESAGSEVC